MRAPGKRWLFAWLWKGHRKRTDDGRGIPWKSYTERKNKMIIGVKNYLARMIEETGRTMKIWLRVTCPRYDCSNMIADRAQFQQELRRSKMVSIIHGQLEKNDLGRRKASGEIRTLTWRRSGNSRDGLNWSDLFKNGQPWGSTRRTTLYRGIEAGNKWISSR